MAFPVSDNVQDSKLLCFPDTSLSICAGTEHTDIVKDFLAYVATEEAGAIFRQMDDADMSYNREDCVNRKGFYIINCPENKMGW